MTNKAPLFGRMFLALVFFSALLLPTPAALAGLTEFFTATGTLSLSVDAGGSNSAQGHVIEVEKPNAAATVRKAFVLAASTGFSGRVLNHGDIAIDGAPIHWDAGVAGAILNSNHRADVTAIVKPIVDAASPGRVAFTFTEVKTGGIDGEILVVVFDDPSQATDTTVSLLFGAQDIAGDNFSITLAQPIDPNAPGALADMGLGISFGCQPGGQRSTVDVNGLRLSSSAGGKKAPGVCKNGQLITVGGLDDSNANPNPNALPAGSRTDDGLYSLLPLITSSDTTISIDTRNPSNDDNLFFAFLQVSAAAVAPSNIALSPATASNTVGAQHTVIASVTDRGGAPAPGTTVTFNVISGPNAGDNGTGATDANGQASFTYTGDGGVGTDQIRASFVTAAGDLRLSNIVTNDWTPVPNTPPVADPQSVTATEDAPKDITLTGSDVDDDPLTFTIVTPPQHGTLSQPALASSAQRSKAQRQVKARLQREKKKPGTMASALRSKDLAAIIQSLSANTVTYTPDPNYNGPDSFTFKVNDGTVDSAPATVSITVTPAQDDPEIQNLTFARRDSSDPNYLTPGIAALLEFRDIDGDFDRLNITFMKARNLPKGCGPDVEASDEVSIFPFSETRIDPDSDPTDFEATEIKALEIGPNAMAVAAANGCNITLELTAFNIRGVDSAQNGSNVLSGTFSIDSDGGTTEAAPLSNQSRASSPLRSSNGTKKIAPPSIR
ncbi:MAG: Ig-like domain-containing protein [Candidatus Binatia bacterium]